ncbi:MAG TPA: YaiI/YqxD family protein [Thauera sp.]|uniref:YaiI/YqxD family protein n=1 Tax=Thauera sp. TaxID=1905334 RepID=UPI002C337695|nr:YaiI/YqxD family protein [Thauera sp.]HRP23405.1 YaiI/YqxD family protein [Thauera sp.]HRP66678.1 YaiI/YqxD family protein [Thauera sp.]
MHIWVDADACPGVIKDILFRAAARTGHPLTLVANQYLRVPAAPNIRMIQVPGGFDEADKYIAAHLHAGDLVITADIPLAADVVARDAHALSPKGELYGKENIRELLDLRNFMDTLRSTGVETGGPAPFSTADRQAFANRLDRLLQRSHRG